ncbi:hypothetical protein CVT25_015122 [Psilocybe cyanescens]|uniref:Heterokaryon incompatibility domain-containing protein n=1 Tax=Psilocybe cyanescens TaxID=93625 RepID=A0A409X1Z9_PSICY|nr:hypothetical protein CVT25_015122 [Psilocybe cyanescens]
MKIVNQYEVAKIVTRDVHRAIIDKVGQLLSLEAEDKLDLLGRQFIEDTAKESAKYAILSHRWGVHETTYQEVREFSRITTKGVQDFIKQHDYYDSFQYNLENIVLTLVKASASGEASSNDRSLIDVLAELCDISSTGGLVNTWKLVRFCDLAYRVYGCEFAWIDTCCIDKTSSAELDESIRSMFRWYQNSHVCLVHLASTYETLGFDQDPWFTRGWTLQELLAPKVIKFHDQFWEPITSASNDKLGAGPKFSFSVHAPEDSDEDQSCHDDNTTDTSTIMERVSHITSIPMDDLLEFKPSLANIRNRLKWASKRETTRVEDQAYCLLGIFKVNMPIAYGEGEAAFHRLQATIVQESNDRSLFLWEGMASEKSSILARAPDCFLSEHDSIDEDILADSASSLDPTFTFTNYGLRIVVLLYSKDLTEKWLLSLNNIQVPSKEDLPKYRLAVLAYKLCSPVTFTSTFSTSTPRRLPIVMLLIQERILNYVRYRRHPWRPRAIDSSMLAESPCSPEAIFIA